MGIWKLVDGKNFDDYLKSLSVYFATRQVATMTNLPHHWSEWRHNHHKNTKHLQEHRDLLQAGNGVWWDNSRWQEGQIPCDVLDGGKLVHMQKWNGQEKTLVQETVDGMPILTPTQGSAVCTHTYKKESWPAHSFNCSSASWLLLDSAPDCLIFLLLHFVQIQLDWRNSLGVRWQQPGSSSILIVYVFVF